MPKEKKKLIDESNERVTLFYYEIIGVVLLLFSIVTLGKLGKVGSILSTIFKILFGDWSFLFVIYLLFMGLFYLFVHEQFNYRNHRFIGFIFLSIMIILFSHFSVHDYVNKVMFEENESYLSTTFGIYKNYLNTGQSSNLGGGLIGGVLFYIINALMGNIGVILIGVFLGILSLSLIFKTPFFDIFKWGFSHLRGTGSLIKSFNNFFKYELGKDIDKNDLKIPLSILDKKNNYKNNDNYDDYLDFDDRNFFEKNEKYILNVKEKIIDILNNNRIKFIKTEYIISNYVTLFSIYTYGIYDESNITTAFDELDIDKYIYLSNEKIVIEFRTKYKINYLLSELLIKDNTKNKLILPIAKSIDNNYVNLNLDEFNNMLIIGNSDDNNEFINTFLTELFILNKASAYDIYMYNSMTDYTIYNKYLNIYESIYSFISHIKEYIDERVNVLNENNCQNYNEYINKYSYKNNLLKRSFIIINSIKEDIDDLKELESELIYLTQFSKKCGISFIYSVTSSNYINNVINSIFDVKLLYKCDSELIMKIANSDEPAYRSLNLFGGGDGFISMNHKFIRVCTPVISDQEKNKISELINKNKVK